MHQTSETIVLWENSFSLYDLKNVRDRLTDAIAKAKNEWITLEINSTGGDCDSGYALYDWILSRSKFQLQTVGFGQISSMAVILFLAGDYRVIGRNTIIYLHEPSREYRTGVSQNVTQMQRGTEYLSRYHELYIQLVLSRTECKVPKDLLREWIRDEHIVTPQEAVQYGFAHEIVP